MKKYEKYKDSKIDWIGEIPEHWEVIKFKFIGNLFSGLSGKSGNDFSKEKKENFKPYIPFTNIYKNKKISKNEYHYVRVENNEKQNFVIKNDILFLMSSETYEDIGKTAIFKENKPVYLNSFCKGFRVQNKDFISDYLNYLMLSSFYRNYFSNKARGFTRINLKQEYILNMPILQLDLNEQTAIANFLDEKTSKIDEAVRIKEREIELLKERRQIIIQEVVTGKKVWVSTSSTTDVSTSSTTGKWVKPQKTKDSGVECLPAGQAGIGEIPEEWEVRKLKNLFNFSKGLTITKANLQDEGVLCVSYGEIHSKYGFELDPKIHQLKYVSSDYIKTDPKSLLRKGDFIFADTSEDLEGSGNFTYLKTDDKVFAGYHTVIAKPKYKLNSRYIAYMLDVNLYRNQVRRQMKGVKVFSITQSILKNLLIWLPAEFEQEKMVDYLDSLCKKIDKSISLKEQEIEKLKEYKTVLIDAAVTGKIRVN